MERLISPLIHIFLWKSSGLAVGCLWMIFRLNFQHQTHVDNIPIIQTIRESFQQPYSLPRIL